MILTTKMTFQKVHFISISISISTLSVLHIFILLKPADSHTAYISQTTPSISNGCRLDFFNKEIQSTSIGISISCLFSSHRLNFNAFHSFWN
ncbi:hypothetical protein Pint_07807 [Pistacia integerrima]|uniref:Uncharacterized protein n=1 Tax=Pistacia integerrima TaxID=434235 RepID=A0ACC0XZJ9_9ROSI|nr:hypothetical protein Pint_07807 [Pistacia integerrima]